VVVYAQHFVPVSVVVGHGLQKERLLKMHNWGDKDFDWDGLEKAISYISKRFRKYKIGVRQAKEKYGTARIYCSLGAYQIHCLTHPGHVYNRYPKWLWILDCKYGKYIVRWFINWWLYPLHKFIYRDTYKRAVKMFPHLEEEIVCCADYPKLLKGL